MDEALREGVIALAHRAAARILAVYDSAAFEDEAAIRQGAQIPGCGQSQPLLTGGGHYGAGQRVVGAFFHRRREA